MFPLISPAGAALSIHAATQIGREEANAKVHVKKHLSPILVWMQVVQKGRKKKKKKAQRIQEDTAYSILGLTHIKGTNCCSLYLSPYVARN